MEAQTRQQQMGQDVDWLVDFAIKSAARVPPLPSGEAYGLRFTLRRPDYLIAVDRLSDGTIVSVATVEHEIAK